MTCNILRVLARSEGGAFWSLLKFADYVEKYDQLYRALLRGEPPHKLDAVSIESMR
jgi:hypothetical protein